MTNFENDRNDSDFLEDLRKIMKSNAVPPLAPQRNPARFREMVELSSVAVVKHGVKHYFHYYNFESGWGNNLFKWFIRHLVRHPEDIEPTRDIMIATIKRYEMERQAAMPWSGGEIVPL